MTERQAGVTALVTAYARAYHADHDDPKIFDDFLASQLYTAEERASFPHSLAGLLALIDPALAAETPDPAAALALVMQIQNGPITLSRSRYCEDSLEEAVRQGAAQYVILGAGLDTFAFRKPELLDRLTVFELDHPVTQELKRQRIAMAGWKVPGGLHFVPVDFTQTSLPAALRSSAYDAEKMGFFSWLGVTYYLPGDVVSATLREIAGLAPRGSTIVFDYLDAEAFSEQNAFSQEKDFSEQKAFSKEKVGRRVQLMQWIARQVGEPMKTGFAPHRLAELLDELGFRLEENLGPAEIEARYFQGRADRYHAFEHIHFARAVVK